MKVSLVTRTFNEVNEIESLALNLRKQTQQPDEVIVVDNGSVDGSVDFCREAGFKVISIDEYLPGKALNLGIRESKYELVVLVSSHCIPADKYWLEKLVQPFSYDSQIVASYGRQIPSKDSTALDYRDLLTVFRNESKVQILDTFFHNANSAIRKSLWKKIPFSDTATNIEDRIWAKEILSLNYKIYYSAEAVVFHPHGINHNANLERAKKIKNVCEIEELYLHDYNEKWFH